MGVQGGHHHERGGAGTDETAGSPDMKRHDGIVNLVLNDHEYYQEDEADQQRGQGSGDSPACSGSFTQVVDDCDDTCGEAGHAQKVDTTVRHVSVCLVRRDDEEASHSQREANDACDVEDPLPA